MESSYGREILGKEAGLRYLYGDSCAPQKENANAFDRWTRDMIHRPIIFFFRARFFAFCGALTRK